MDALHWRISTVLITLVTTFACGSRAPAPTAPAAPVGARAAGADSAAVADSAATSASTGADDKGGDAGDEGKVIELDPLRIQVVTDESGDKQLIHYDSRMLLDAGNEAMTAGRFDQAIASYDKLVAEFPESALVVAAHYNAGLAYEGKGDFDTAIARFRAVITLQPRGRDSVDAHVEIGIVLSQLERWAEAQRVFEELIQRSDLTPSEQIECKARLGYVLVEQKIYARAEAVLNEALAYFENVTKTAQLDSNYFVAMCNYYLANIPHRQARVVELRVTGPSGDDQLKADIVAKRELIKLAYDRYLVALRRRNAYWATASGYQMSQMFKEFWDDLVLAPVPPHLDAREAGFYVKEVHKQSRELLSKALYGHTQTVELAEAYRTSTEWSEASRVRAEQITEILARESAGELVEPPPEGALPKPGRGLANPAAYMPGRIEL